MPEGSPPEGLRGYAICSEPRSGSNFLCQLLESTGVLGRPRDWLNVRGMREKLDPAYPTDPRAQVARILGDGRSANGVYGFKMFSLRFDDIEAVPWAGLLPGLHFVHLQRRDLLGQAISDWRAVQSGQYRSTSRGTREPLYDRAAIARRIAEIAHREGRWRRWFARNGIAPLTLVYEEVAADPQAAAEAVAALLDVTEPVRVDLSKLSVRVQRDAVSERWRERFVADSRNMQRLDDDPWPRSRMRFARLLRRLRREIL